MKFPDINKTFGWTVFVQLAAGWTALSLIGYLIGGAWLGNELATFLLVWGMGLLGLGSIILRQDRGAATFIEEGKNGNNSSLIYHAVLETSPDSVAITDLLGNYIFANKQTAAIHGYDSTDEFVGRNALSLFPINEVARAAKFMDLTRTDGLIKNIEFNILRKDGSSFPAELSAALIKNEFGIPVAFIAVTRDITDRKQAADQLRDMNEQLRMQLQEIEKLQSILKEQAIRDPLTGLYNRRFMEETLKQEIARAKREDQSFTIVMLDMDNLKTLNDLHGHMTGDLAIKAVSKYLQSKTRTGDIVCRYGGDEFLVIMHNTNERTTLRRLQEWKNDIGVTETTTTSFSIGVATYPTHGQTLEDLLRNADNELYKAKAGKT